MIQRLIRGPWDMCAPMLWRLALVVLLAACPVARARAQTVAKVTLSPTSVVGGANSTGTVSIAKKASAQGAVVTLSSSTASATVISSVTIESGKTSGTFTVQTVAVRANTSATIKAAIGASSASAVLTVKAPTFSTFSFVPTSLTGGASATGSIKISSAAPVGGLVIAVTSNQAAAKVPTSVSVPAGTNTTTFGISTSPVAAKTSAKITVSLGASSIGNTLAILPPVLSSLSLNPSTLSGGGSSTGTVMLSGVAPTGGLTVTLTSSNKSVTVPKNVVVAAGATSATFAVKTVSVTAKATATITAKLSNSVTAALTVTAGSRFAGSYIGSYYSYDTTSVGIDIGSVTIEISATGALSGHVDDALTVRPQTLVGMIDDAGATTVKSTGPSNTSTSTGSLGLNSFGFLTGTLTDSNVITVVTINKVGQPLEYAGKYTGTYASVMDPGGTVSVTILPSGAISCTGKPSNGGTITVVGTMTTGGIINVTVTSPNGTDTNTGGAAFNANGKLIVIAVDPSSLSQTVLTLTKS